MKIMAFAYKKGVGKDTLGKFLMTHLRIKYPGMNIQHISFAAKLKDICFQLYGWAGLQRGIYYETHRDEKEIVLPLLGLSPRQIWIGVGNKIREVHQSTWIDFALNRQKANVTIITDCGFVNEALAIRKAGGFLCKINRDGLEQGTDGREVELDSWHDWDRVVDNNCSMHDLNIIAESLAAQLMTCKRT